MDGFEPRQPQPEFQAEPPLFASFFIGGFEGSTHRRRDGRQLDVIAATKHDQYARADYLALRSCGIRTVRDALRWHLIERAPCAYDWSSFLPMLEAASQTGTQVIWDLCHYGVPADLDIWSAEFVRRFAAFAGAAASVVRDETEEVPVYCPMNEISFWAWAGGDHRKMHPGGAGRGGELKRQLVRAALAAIEAVRAVDPRARFIHPEPLIHVAAMPGKAEDERDAKAYSRAQFEACDMIAGRLAPELGGSEDHLDMLGVNFYFDNQWMIRGGRTIGLGDPLYRPLSGMLGEVARRYGRPVVVSETGAEGRNGPAWLRYVAGEVRAARRSGVPVEGICLYPVMDYPGWDNSRHCRCGLLEADAKWNARTVDAALLAQLEEEQLRMAAPRLGQASRLEEAVPLDG